MKKSLLGVVLIPLVLTLATGAANTQLLTANIKHQMVASDGTGPMPTCRPGANCDSADQLRAGVKVGKVFGLADLPERA